MQSACLEATQKASRFSVAMCVFTAVCHRAVSQKICERLHRFPAYCVIYFGLAEPGWLQMCKKSFKAFFFFMHWGKFRHLDFTKDLLVWTFSLPLTFLLNAYLNLACYFIAICCLIVLPWKYLVVGNHSGLAHIRVYVTSLVHSWKRPFTAMRNVTRAFKTPFLSVTESSAGFYLLLSFIPRLQLLQKTLSEITLAFIQELLCPAGSG